MTFTDKLFTTESKATKYTVADTDLNIFMMFMPLLYGQFIHAQVILLTKLRLLTGFNGNLRIISLLFLSGIN